MRGTDPINSNWVCPILYMVDLLLINLICIKYYRFNSYKYSV